MATTTVNNQLKVDSNWLRKAGGKSRHISKSLDIPIRPFWELGRLSRFKLRDLAVQSSREREREREGFKDLTAVREWAVAGQSFSDTSTNYSI